MALSERATQTCPSDDALRRYHAHELDEAEQRAFRHHLEQCPSCAARAQHLLTEHETWIQQLRRVGIPPDTGRPVPPPVETPLRPEDLTGYELRDEISRGGQGIVYRAIQTSTKREVALKLLREGAYASPAARKRFEREIELVAALRHPNIVTVFDSGTTRGGRKFFVMDFVHGQPLARYLRSAALPQRAQLQLFIKICAAVNAAHQRGVIHRDLKPSNVLVNEAGEPFVLDFGLARQVAGAERTAMTTTGQVAGTLPYMSPEQARGLPDALDVRSNVYALGVMLYEMLTGTYPYPVDGDTIHVLRTIAEAPPTPPNQVATRTPGAARIPDDLQTIVLKTLAKAPERRYQTAGELARDLGHFLANEPIEAKRDSGLYLLKKTLQRYRVGVAVAGAFVLLITASAIALGVMYANQMRLREEAERQAQAARVAEAQATRRFNDLHNLARSFILKFDPLIERLPGSAPARQALVSTALKYLDALAKDAAGNSELQHDLAAAYMTIGDVQGDPQASNLGEFTGALESYRKAGEIFATLRAAHPDDAELQRSGILNLLKTADVLGVLGDLQTARTVLADAAARADAACARHPDHSVLAMARSHSYERLGNVYLTLNQSDEALTCFEKARQTRSTLPPGAPAAVAPGHEYVAGLMHIGNLEFTHGEFEPALEHYRAANEAAVELHAAFPNDVAVRRELALTHQWLGIVPAALGRHADALPSYAAAIALLEQFLVDSPNDDTFQGDLATTLSKLGESQMALGRRDAAHATFLRSLELTRAAAQRQPEVAPFQRLLGVAYYKMYELDAAPAQDASLPAAQRIAYGESARAWLQHCAQVFLGLRERGLLTPADEGVPADLAREIEQIDAALVQLRGPDVTSAPAEPPATQPTPTSSTHDTH